MKREGSGRQLRPEEVDALENEEPEEAGTFKKATQRSAIPTLRYFIAICYMTIVYFISSWIHFPTFCIYDVISQFFCVLITVIS